MARVALDLIPEAARPPEVAAVLAEAVELHDRHRAANEQLAAAQAELERQEQADVKAAAPSIQRATANGQALTIGELIVFLHEAVQPPAPIPEPILGSPSDAPVEATAHGAARGPSRSGRPMISEMRGDLIAAAYAALDAGEVGPLEALLDPQVRWIGVGDSWGETPT